MGIIRDVILGTPEPQPAPAQAAIQPFRIGRGLEAYTIAGTTRTDAMSVPAVARARNLIAGTIAAMPLEMFITDRQTLERRQAAPLPWVEQPQADIPRLTTIAYTIDSLWFRWVNPSDITFDVDLETGLVTRYYFRLTPTPTSGIGSLIVFTGVDEGLLVRAGQTIKTCVDLERAALEFARNPAPAITLKNTGMDLPADQVQGLLDKWRESRRAAGGAVAYLSAALEMDTPSASHLATSPWSRPASSRSSRSPAPPASLPRSSRPTSEA